MIKNFFLFIFLLSCTLQNFFHEGEGKCYQLVKILKKVESREDLLRMEDLLKKKFQEVVDILIAAHKYAEKHPNIFSHEPNDYNDELMEEFKRIYSIEGCRELIENMQRESLIRLDAYLNKRKK